MSKFGILIISICFAFAVNAQTPKWVGWETQADTLLSREDFRGAINGYTKVIKANKLQEDVHYGPLYKRAVAYYSSGDFTNAVKDMDQFIPKFPRSYQARILRALSNRELDELEKQLIDVEEALVLSNGDPQILKWRAGLLLEQEEFEKAKKDLLLIRQFQSDAESEMNLGFAYYSLGNYDSAIIALNKAIVLDAMFEPTYLYAGSFSLEEEKYQVAVQYLNLALRLNPENTMALFYKGIALVELKKEKEGCRCLEKAFAAGQDDAADYLKQYCYGVED